MKNNNYTETINNTPFNMIFVKGGDVFMGSNKEHKVTVPDFHIAETPCTQALWRAVMGEDPKELYFKGNDDRPVEVVSWDDIVLGTPETNGKAFLAELNRQATRKGYQLPSEAIWQFAAQGGNLSNGYEYAGSNNLKEVGWFDKNSHSETKPVKLKLPNELGLYDMSGNVREWCADIWNQDVKKLPINGLPNEDGEKGIRVVRGGSWVIRYFDVGCRVALRGRDVAGFRDSSGFGFRLIRY